ncbi:uncharacterized protein TNCV_1528351 [Trichonephila clavipes]|nr:uncharacterized protein TNCV_1528351 [Trichonephila clavipes]
MQDSKCSREFQTWWAEKYGMINKGVKAVCVLCSGTVKRYYYKKLQVLPKLEEKVAAVAEWYRYRTVACLVTSSSPVPLKIRRVEQRCTLNLSRAETSFRWCGVVVRRGGASSGVVHVT